MCRYVTALILSHKFNLKFVYRPFKITVNTPQCNWEEFLGFGEGELKYENVINDKSIKIINLPHVDMRHSRWLQLSLLNTIINRIYPNDKILFLQTPHSFFPVDDTPLSKPIFSMLQNKYWRNREKYPVENHFDEKKLKVAVHVRRGEITHLKKIKHPQGLCRWVDNAWYIAVLKKINQLFTEQHVDIHVYSDAYNKDELDEFEELSNTTIHLKKDDIRQPFQAFHAMVIADIGVCGITGFSSSSGMLSKGIKIVPPSAVREVYFPTGPQWIFSDKKGNFDINVLLKKYPEFL